jgi:hypothetical protein
MNSVSSEYHQERNEKPTFSQVSEQEPCQDSKAEQVAMFCVLLWRDVRNLRNAEYNFHLEFSL